TDARLSEPVGAFGPVGTADAPSRPGDPGAAPVGYEVQFLVETDEPGVAELRHALGSLGDSVVVVGGGGASQAHVHSERPGAAIEAGLAAGPIPHVSVVSLPAALACDVDPAREMGGTGAAAALIVVVGGDGLARTFASLGAAVVDGADP